MFSDLTYLTNPSSINSLSGAKQAIYSWADFLFGAPSHYELDNNPVAHLRQRIYFGYLQDDWRASDKLTLNLGVRYEFVTPQYEANNKLANFDPSTDSLIYTSGGSIYNQALVQPDHNNWAPRVGLAYQASAKTVIRSGYGINYVQFNRLGGENLLAYNGPNVVDSFIDQTPKQAACTSVNAAAALASAPLNKAFRITSRCPHLSTRLSAKFVTFPETTGLDMWRTGTSACSRR